MDGVVEVKRLVVTARTAGWCRLPYPGHPKGCPNYGNPEHEGCPPSCGSVEDFVDPDRPMHLVYREFDLERHAAAMGERHPGWSERQKRNCLYWQNGVRRLLNVRCRYALRMGLGNVYTTCPEGMGVNVFATARLAGLSLDKTRRIRIDRHVALIGWRKA